MGTQRRGTSAGAAGSLVVVLLLAGLVLLDPGGTMRTLRALAGYGSGRLEAAPHVADGQGRYAFSLTQTGSDQPVGYDPCHPVRVVVNPEGAPPGGSTLIATGIARVAAATGLRFEVEGTTDDRNFSERTALRSPAHSDPVLVGWSTEEELPELAGTVAGIGGSTAVGAGRATMRYVTGMVALDRDAFTRLAARPDGYATAQAIVDHELAHLVGLAHVDDPHELMNADSSAAVTEFGPGDREGLARLGSVPCR